MQQFFGMCSFQNNVPTQSKKLTKFLIDKFYFLGLNSLLPFSIISFFLFLCLFYRHCAEHFRYRQFFPVILQTHILSMRICVIFSFLILTNRVGAEGFLEGLNIPQKNTLFLFVLRFVSQSFSPLLGCRKVFSMPSSTNILEARHAHLRVLPKGSSSVFQLSGHNPTGFESIEEREREREREREKSF